MEDENFNKKNALLIEDKITNRKELNLTENIEQEGKSKINL